MTFLKSLGIAALVAFLGTGCVKKSYQQRELEQYAHALVLRVMETQERDLHIDYDGEIPDVQTDQLFGSDGKYDCSDKVITLSSALSFSTLLDREKLEETSSHELGHHYFYLRDEQQGNKYCYAAIDLEATTFRNFFYFSEKFRRHNSSEHWREYLQDWERHRQENSSAYSKWAFWKVIKEGVAECFGNKTDPRLDFYQDRNLPETYLAITDPYVEDSLIYGGGYHPIKPLMDEFGVQPVVDYIVTHEPEVTGKLREDVLKYQKQVQDALRGEQ